MRKLFLAFSSMSLLAIFAAAQSTNIDIATFIKGTTQAGTLIQDPAAPVSLQLPSGWTLKNGIRWGDHETTLWFVETESGITAAFYYQYPLQQKSPADPYEALQQGMQAKVQQRVEREGMKDYHVRPGSVRKREVGGQPALSFIADFTSQELTRSEYMVRVLGNATKGHFFVMDIPAAADIDAFCQRLEPIVTSLRIP